MVWRADSELSLNAEGPSLAKLPVSIIISHYKHTQEKLEKTKNNNYILKWKSLHVVREVPSWSMSVCQVSECHVHFSLSLQTLPIAVYISPFTCWDYIPPSLVRGLEIKRWERGGRKQATQKRGRQRHERKSRETGWQYWTVTRLTTLLRHTHTHTTLNTTINRSSHPNTIVLPAITVFSAWLWDIFQLFTFFC